MVQRLISFDLLQSVEIDLILFDRVVEVGLLQLLIFISRHLQHMCVVFAICVVEVLPWRVRAYFIEYCFIFNVVAEIRPEVLHPISNMEMEMHVLHLVIMVRSVCSVARPKAANREALAICWQIYVSHWRNCWGSHARFLFWRYWQNPPGHLSTSKPVNLWCC